MSLECNKSMKIKHCNYGKGGERQSVTVEPYRNTMSYVCEKEFSRRGKGQRLTMLLFNTARHVTTGPRLMTI